MRHAQAGVGRHLVVLVGPSGSGTSSVLRAGLVPRVGAEPPVGEAPRAVALPVPGTDPVGALEAARAQIWQAPHALLIVDQAEEVFSPQVGAERRSAFVRELAAETDGNRADGWTVVVVTAPAR